MAREPSDIRHAARGDLRPLAEWVCRVSRAPERQCIHSWSGESAADLAERLTRYLDDSELCYLLASERGRLLGAMGAEYDRALGRAWLHGPHVGPDPADDVAARLFERLLEELPAEIERLTAYVNVENTAARAFYAERGFRERATVSHEFWLDPSDHRTAADSDARSLADEHHDSFRSLYASLFPAAYYSADRVIQMMGSSHHVLVLADGPGVLGFAVVAAEVPGSSGEVQFLGVREDCRGSGLGRKLLASAVDWLFGAARVPRVTLNVDGDLRDARRLYESVGFKLRFSGIGLGRER